MQKTPQAANIAYAQAFNRYFRSILVLFRNFSEIHFFPPKSHNSAKNAIFSKFGVFLILGACEREMVILAC